MRPRKSTLFHIVNISGWMGLLLANAYIARFFELTDARRIAWAVCFFGSGALICLGIRYVYIKADYRSRPLGSLTMIVILTSLAAAGAWLAMEHASYFMVYSSSYSLADLKSKLILSHLAGRMLSNFWPFMMWSILYLAVNLWLDWRRERARAAEALMLAQKAQLQMLRYQLNPHFLFNALNSVRALVDESTEAARDMITELSEFLRYSLVNRECSEAPLSMEMEAIGHYLSIQKRRYEDKLQVTTEVSNAAGGYPVPCFLLHPVVENAVKYGMQTSAMPLRLSIRAKTDDAGLRISVSNTGIWVPPESRGEDSEPGTGTGLSNVRRRLAVAYPGRHQFKIAESDGTVTVDIYLIRPQRRTGNER